MLTAVLDDDPTGTQAATDVGVVLDLNREAVRAAFDASDAVYLQTNSRALDEGTAVALAAQLKDWLAEIAAERGEEILVVLRGDSTLRGHVFPETDVFLEPGSLMVFLPAFPAGGRTTTDGVHYVEVDGTRIPAAESEFAGNPVFGFRSSGLVDYVAEKGARDGVSIPLAVVRGERADLVDALLAVPEGAVALPDAETDEDIRAVAEAIREAAGRRHIVIRSAAPLAAFLAGVASTGLLPRPLPVGDGGVLVVCGSHTGAAGEQLGALRDAGVPIHEVDTDAALADPAAAAEAVVAAARADLESRGLAVITSQRERRAEHNTLAHGEKVMQALVHAARELLPQVGCVVTKGGITSADITTKALGASTATVLGQVAAGISVWRTTGDDGRERVSVIVPGNVGSAGTLVDVLAAVGRAVR